MCGLALGAMALHYVADRALDDLLTAWRHYDDMRSKPEVKIADLGRARCILDDARVRMNRIRSAMHPNASEQTRVQMVVLCQTLDEVVHLGWDHVEPDDRTNLRCICGHLVTTEIASPV